MHIEFFNKVLILHRLSHLDDGRIICAVAETASEVASSYDPEIESMEEFIVRQKQLRTLSPECYLLDQVGTTDGWDFIGIKSCDAIARMGVQIDSLHKTLEEIRAEQVPGIGCPIVTHEYVIMDALRFGGNVRAVRSRQ